MISSVKVVSSFNFSALCNNGIAHSKQGFVSVFLNGGNKFLESNKMKIENKSLSSKWVRFNGGVSVRSDWDTDYHNEKDIESTPPQSSISGVVLEESKPFSPLEIIQNADVSSNLVPQVKNHSLARQRYAQSTEAALNDSINVAYSMSYAFHSIYAFFDRDYIALPGFAKYFNHRSYSERKDAEELMSYQNMRGGKVFLNSLPQTQTEFDHQEKGDALNAMEITLALEKVQNEKYLNLHKVAEDAGDAEMCDFVVKNVLNPQVEKIKRSSDYVSQLRRIGKGHGVWHFDRELDEKDYN